MEQTKEKLAKDFSRYSDEISWLVSYWFTNDEVPKNSYSEFKEKFAKMKERFEDLYELTDSIERS